MPILSPSDQKVGHSKQVSTPGLLPASIIVRASCERLSACRQTLAGEEEGESRVLGA